MHKYIDADTLLKAIDEASPDHIQEVAFPGYTDTIDFLDKDTIIEIINEMPVADVEPVKWISVDERLPEYNEAQGANAYWVARKKRNGEFGMQLALYCDYGYAMEIEGIPTKITWRDWDFHVVENVTHWMPLPEPPKMDGGSECR